MNKIKFKKKNIKISILCIFIAFIIFTFISYKMEEVKYNKLLDKRNNCEVTLDEIISKANSIKASSEIEIENILYKDELVEKIINSDADKEFFKEFPPKDFPSKDSIEEDIPTLNAEETKLIKQTINYLIQQYENGNMYKNPIPNLYIIKYLLKITESDKLYYSLHRDYYLLTYFKQLCELKISDKNNDKYLERNIKKEIKNVKEDKIFIND